MCTENVCECACIQSWDMDDDVGLKICRSSFIDPGIKRPVYPAKDFAYE